jgi:ABC-type antimicrobial peptide transport system permease subunit
LGRRFKQSAQSDWVTVIGIVGDVKQRGLEREAYPQFYSPYSSYPHNIMSFAVRTSGRPGSLIPAIRREVASLDPQLPFNHFMTIEELVARTVAGRRLATVLLAMFAGMALILAIVGLYGVISYLVAQRTNEIGIRMALGARSADVTRLVMARGLGWTIVGLVAGVAVSLATGAVISTLLYGTSPTDPVIYVGVCALLLAVAAAACWVPARRATQIDPLIALRQEQ